MMRRLITNCCVDDIIYADGNSGVSCMVNFCSRHNKSAAPLFFETGTMERHFFAC